MAAFDDVLAKLKGWDSETPPPADLFETLATEHEKLANDFRAVTDQRDGATVHISERDARIAELASEVSRLKGENYDLAIRVGIRDDSNDQKQKDDNPPTGVSGLFRKVNKA